MDISTIMKLCFHFSFCQIVVSSRHTFLQIEMSSEYDFDNVLEKFFIDLDKVFLQIYKPRYITIVGASNNEYLQQAQPLFQRYPFIICQKTERCSDWQQFSEESFVIVFLDDLSAETLEERLKILSRSRECKVLFISTGIINGNDVWLIFTLAKQYNVPYTRFVHLGKEVIEFYSEIVATNCTMTAELVDVWRPGVGLKMIQSWAFQVRTMNGCPVSVSSLTFIPKMIIKENENGSLTVVGGKEGKMLLTIASKMNFTIKLRYPPVVEQQKYSRKVAIMNDVASGISEIGIGRLRPTIYLNNTIAISLPYDEECITWGVPRLMKWSNDIVWVEFSWQVWISIGLVFTVCCIIRYAHRDIVTPKDGQRTNLGFISIVLDVISLHLGNPVVHVSSSAGGRFMLTASLYYAMVITTAYQTSLASILTTDVGTPIIVDAQGIIDANLDVGGSLYDYNILKDQVDDSEVNSKLLERFVINNNNSQSWRRLLFDHNYAFLARSSFMSYDRQIIIKANESVTFDVLSGCVLSYPTVMLFQARSYLLPPIDKIIQHLVESGILWHWDRDEFDTEKLLKHKSTEKYFEKRAVLRFFNLFILYLVCVAISLLIFLIELLVPRLVSTNRQSHITVKQFYGT